MILRDRKYVSNCLGQIATSSGWRENTLLLRESTPASFWSDGWLSDGLRDAGKNLLCSRSAALRLAEAGRSSLCNVSSVEGQRSHSQRLPSNQYSFTFFRCLNSSGWRQLGRTRKRFSRIRSASSFSLLYFSEVARLEFSRIRFPLA